MLRMFHNHKEKISMMRVGFFLCLTVGSITALSGIIAVFMSLSGAETLVMSGSSLMGTSGFAKAVQSKWEHST